jgi:putative NADH-flavin reductase
MKLAIIGATGNVGHLVLEKALKAGMDVTAIVRSPEKLTQDVPFIKRDILDITAEDLQGFDAIVDALRAPDGNEQLYIDATKHLIEVMQANPARLIVVGGTSSLYMDDSHTQRYIDLVDPSAPFYPTAKFMADSSELLKASNLNWTFFSPAAWFDPRGAETGDYSMAGDVFEMNASEESYISMADYAAALISILENGQGIKQHISIFKN